MVPSPLMVLFVPFFEALITCGGAVIERPGRSIGVGTAPTSLVAVTRGAITTFDTESGRPHAERLLLDMRSKLEDWILPHDLAEGHDRRAIEHPVDGPQLAHKPHVYFVRAQRNQSRG